MSSVKAHELVFVVTCLRLYLQLGGYKFGYIIIKLPPLAMILIYHMQCLTQVPMGLLSQCKCRKFT